MKGAGNKRETWEVDMGTTVQEDHRRRWESNFDDPCLIPHEREGERTATGLHQHRPRVEDSTSLSEND